MYLRLSTLSWQASATDLTRKVSRSSIMLNSLKHEKGSVSTGAWPSLQFLLQWLQQRGLSCQSSENSRRRPNTIMSSIKNALLTTSESAELSLQVISVIDDPASNKCHILHCPLLYQKQSSGIWLSKAQSSHGPPLPSEHVWQPWPEVYSKWLHLKEWIQRNNFWFLPVW